MLRKDPGLCCIANVSFQLSYFAAIEICLTCPLVSTTAKNIAVLVGPLFRAFNSLFVTKAGKHIYNWLSSLTHLWELNAYIFVIIIFLIGARLIWFFKVFWRGWISEIFWGDCTWAQMMLGTTEGDWSQGKMMCLTCVSGILQCDYCW